MEAFTKDDLKPLVEKLTPVFMAHYDQSGRERQGLETGLVSSDCAVVVRDLAGPAARYAARTVYQLNDVPGGQPLTVVDPHAKPLRVLLGKRVKRSIVSESSLADLFQDVLRMPISRYCSEQESIALWVFLLIFSSAMPDVSTQDLSDLGHRLTWRLTEIVHEVTDVADAVLNRKPSA